MSIYPKTYMKTKCFPLVFFISIWGILFICSCHQKHNFDGLSASKPTWFSEYPFYSNKEYYYFFKNEILKSQKNDSIHLIMKDFYSKNEPFWTNNGFQSDNIHKMIAILSASNSHGIASEKFNLNYILQLKDSIEKFKVKNQNDLFEVLFKIEFELTEGYLNYSKFLYFGFTEPEKMHPGKWLFESRKATPAFYVQILNQIDQFPSVIDSLTLQTKEYAVLRDKLQFYNQLNDTLPLDTFKHTKYYFIDKLKANLERLRWRVFPLEQDYIVINIPEFHLKAYIKDSCYLKLKICCGKPLTKTQIEKSGLNEGVYPSGKWETPLLKSNITSLVLNPEWNIPYSILKEEYFPQLKKDHLGIIQKDKLMVYNNKRERVDPEQIDWKKYSEKNIPFVLVQSAGNHNALGRVKFDFYNIESVYIHDTPNQRAFKKKNRAISHGCCRLENPTDLAYMILKYNEIQEDEIERIFIIMDKDPITDQGKQFLDSMTQKENVYFEKLSDQERKYYRKIRPVRFKLKKSIPLYLQYYTCVLDEKDSVQFYEDVYNKDNGIIYQLNKK